MLTREQLPNLSEDALRRHILIPLFQGMGYRDVMDHHGGPLEQGKDIVMWKPGELRERLNYAVVIKRKVNGKASGAGSAGEVVAQITQCFGKPYIDRKTSEERNVDRCLVVVANAIPKEFTNATSGPLKQAGLTSVTDFVDADQLWKWIEKHRPEKTIFSSVQQLQSLISEHLPGFSAEIQVSEKKLSLGLKPINPEALSPQSVVFHISLEGEAGKKAREQYEKFVKTGAGFTISKEQLKSIELPELLKRAFDITDDRIHSFRFDPAPSGPIRWHFKRVCDSGITAELRDIELKTVQAGTEQATLTNQDQNVPWKFTVLADPRANGTGISISHRTKVAGVNVRQVLEWFRFHYAMSQPGVLTLEHAETGIEFPASPDSGRISPPNEALVTIVEKLAYIQTKTRTPVPFRSTITEEDAQAVEELYTIVKTGRLPVDSFTAEFERARIVGAAEALKTPGALNVEFNDSMHRVCFGVSFDLGPSRLVSANIMPDSESAQTIQAELKNPKSTDGIQLTFKPVADGFIEMIYPKWLSEA